MTETKKFYVTMIRDTRVAYLLGPFVHHDDALAAVPFAREAAYRADPWSHFDAFGTTGVTMGNHPRGVLG